VPGCTARSTLCPRERVLPRGVDSEAADVFEIWLASHDLRDDFGGGLGISAWYIEAIAGDLDTSTRAELAQRMAWLERWRHQHHDELKAIHDKDNGKGT
jgi:hypothetical protein